MVMKFLVLTKRRLITAASALAACVLVAVLSVQGILAIQASTQDVAQAASQDRKLPIYCVDSQEKKLAISFDAAWGNEQTEELIQILDRYNVKTTFFVVGDWVDKYPESVKALADAGHEVCNHSDTHPYMTKLSQEQKIQQLQNCNDKIKAITGVSPTLFRPPYGDYNNGVIEATDSIGMFTIQWDVDSLDWKDPTVDEMVNRVTSKVTNGSIVLFHNGAKNTPAALPKILEKLQADGYTIVPISELIMTENFTIDHAGKQIAQGSSASSTVE